jgi:hypothetical protein
MTKIEWYREMETIKRKILYNGRKKVTINMEMEEQRQDHREMETLKRKLSD